MLNLWLESSEVLSDMNTKNFFDFRFRSDSDDLENFRECDVAIIGFDKIFSDAVRYELQKFFNHFRNIKIADLGNIKHHEIDFILPFVDELQNAGIVPVMVGAGPEFIQAMANLSKVSTTLISNSIQEELSFGSAPVNYLAFQRHLVPYNVLGTLEENCLTALSLGKFRSNPGYLEPFLRDCGLLCLNMNAVRASEVPNIRDAYPSGLNTEELCQIMKYAGMSNKLQSVVIRADLGADITVESKVTAQAIWYMMEGKNICIADHPMENTPCREFLVNVPELDTDITFVRSEISGKWWLKVPDINENEVIFIACAYEEYQQAVGGNELPERLLKFVLH